MLRVISPYFGLGAIIVVPIIYFLIAVSMGLVIGRSAFLIAAAFNVGGAAVLMAGLIADDYENTGTLIGVGIFLVALSGLGATGVFVPDWMSELFRVDAETELSLEVSPEFRAICEEIIEAQRDEDEWAEVESDDMFRSASFCGGFEASERAFTFSYYDERKCEYWLQVTLDEAREIAEGRRISLVLRPAE